MVSKIDIYFPFIFSERLDPRNIFTVGDQVLSEHVFSFMAKVGFKSGFSGVNFDITFNEADSTITFKPKYMPTTPNGASLKLEDICNELRKSFSGTRHAPYANLLLDIKCNHSLNQIEAEFKKIPLNLRFLFTIPDFSIPISSSIPMTSENSRATSTGPYYISKYTSQQIQLSINTNYPEELRANNIPSATINAYVAGETESFVERLDPEKVHAAYFFGYALTQNLIEKITSKGYSVETYPSEWLLYLIAGKNLKHETRNLIIQIIEQFKEQEVNSLSLGQPAYSISPSDRPYSLSKKDYDKTLTNKIATGSTLTSITTLKNWANIPVIKLVIEKLKSKIPNLNVNLLESNQVMSLFNRENELVITPLGISPHDPLTHLSFLESTLADLNKYVKKAEIESASIITSPELFNNTIKGIEKKIYDSNIVIPIAHFPGIVAHRKDFTVDEKIKYGWGIQAWSFQIN